MARALVGYIGSGSEQALGLEILRLRRRVQALEAELADLRAATSTTLDLELHRLAEDTEPALA